MLRTGRRLLLALVAFALIGGTTSQLALATANSAYMSIATMPCDMAMPGMDAGHHKPMPPCKGLTPDCIKQMGCVANTALPPHLVGFERSMQGRLVDYWPTRPNFAGAENAPEPLPPRTT